MYENMLQNASNCTIQKFFFGKHAPKPSKQTHGYATRRKPPPPPKKKNSWPPWQILHTSMTTEKFIWESTLADS